ncbi:MAG: hypothetical protein ACLQVA_03845 [Candidatus Brocadiia bacterium]
MIIPQFLRDLGAASRMPKQSVDLMCAAAANNDPFYERIVRKLYKDGRRRHPKFPLIRQFQYGVALCVLPKDFETYFMMVEAAARRNYKKALRNNYTFDRINFNDHLADIQEVVCSTEVRQGKEFARWEVKPCQDPPTRTDIHDYPYFGVLRDGKLVAYAGCLVGGEVCLLEQILGHAEYLEDGVVPMLIIGIAKYVLSHYPRVRYYVYSTFFGATPTMRRFKRKFGFVPHRVEWLLDRKSP